MTGSYWLLKGTPLYFCPQVGDLNGAHKKHYENIHRAYPEAKVASIDSGGLFPFLSRYEEFAAYMKVS